MGYVLSRYLTITYNTHTHNTNTSGTIKSNIKGIAQSTICSVAFNQKRGTLAVGTRSGHLLMWKFLGFVSSSTTGPKSWSLVYHTKLCSLEGGSAILQLQWAQRHLLSVRTESSRVFVLNETSLHSCYVDGSVVVQTSPNALTIQQSGIESKGEETKSSALVTVPVSCKLRIRGVTMSADYLCVWSGRDVEVHFLSLSFSLFFKHTH